MELAPHLQGLLTALGPAQRRKLAREVGTELRRRQQQRIAAQVDPDGTPYAPRKPRLRTKAGRIRRALFARLRTTRYLRVEATADTAFVTIAGRAARIARVHQYGLTDRVSPKGPVVRYTERRILGFSGADEGAIADLIVDHLSRAL